MLGFFSFCPGNRSGDLSFVVVRFSISTCWIFSCLSLFGLFSFCSGQCCGYFIFCSAVFANGRLRGLLTSSGSFCMLGFSFLLFFFKAGLAGFKTLFGFFCFVFIVALYSDLRLCLTIIMHQRNFTGTNISTGAALDAVKQVVFFSFIKLQSLTVPVHLLWQQAYRAGVGTGTTANTCQLPLTKV